MSDHPTPETAKRYLVARDPRCGCAKSRMVKPPWTVAEGRGWKRLWESNGMVVGWENGAPNMDGCSVCREPLGPQVKALVKERDALRAALNEIHGWLVCAPIASNDDMAQSFPTMERIAAKALGIVDTTHEAKEGTQQA